MTRKSTFLNEYKDIKIDIFDAAQKDFIYDLLIQASLKNFKYEYNDEILNIVDVETDDNQKSIRIIFQKDLPKLQRGSQEETTRKRKYTKRLQDRMNKKYKITGYMTPRVRKKYNLEIGDVFDNARQLMEYTGLGDAVLYGWISKKWVELI